MVWNSEDWSLEIEMKKNKVIVVGSYNVDMTITTDVFPRAGETVIGNNLIYGHGGKGANQAVAAARSGAQTTLLAKVGADQYGERAISALNAEGINTHYIQPTQGTPTGMASITVNAQGENSIVVISGANWKLSAADILENSKIFQDADILLTQLETPMESVEAAINIASSNGVTVILNPAPVQTLPPELYKDITIMTPNRGEAEMLTGIKITDSNSLARAADALHSYGIESVLITLGSEGVFISSPGKQKMIASIDVEAIDTVGAGDVFSGVLAANYTGQETLEDVVALAITAAGLSVTQRGAQTAIPCQKEVNAYLQNQILVENH